VDTVLLVALGAVVAGFVQGLSGFAFAMVAMAIWAWGLEPQVAVVLAVFGGLTGQVVSVLVLRRQLQWPPVLPFLWGAALGLPLGAWLLPWVDTLWLKTLLGALLVTWCPLMLMGPKLPRLPAGAGWGLRLGDAAAGLGGACLGVLGGFSGALPSLWCLLRGFDKDSQRAVTQNFNLTVLAVTFASYGGRGMVTVDLLPHLAVVAAAVVVPVLLGSRLYIGLSEQAFRRVVMVLLTLAGVALLVSTWPAWRA